MLIRSSLVVVQAALSVVLLIGAGLFVRSLLNVRGQDLGFEPARVMVAEVRWPRLSELPEETRAAERLRRNLILDDATEVFSQLPEVAAASSAIGLPFRDEFGLSLRVPGWDSLPRIDGSPRPRIAAVAPGYFDVMGSRIVRGREFLPSDAASSESVTIVNETMARTFWPQQDALGRCLVIAQSERCTRVVGVAGDIRFNSIRPRPVMQYYVPITQQPGLNPRVLVVRPRRGMESAAAAAVRRELLRLDPSITYATMSTLQDTIDPLVRPWRLGATVFVFFGALAFLIALVGLYSLVAYLVSSRTREFGVRIALGARSRDIGVMIVRQATTLTLAGIAIGTLAAIVIGRYVSELLFDVSARDPGIFALIALGLIAATVLASLLPARRGARVDPVESLRAE